MTWGFMCATTGPSLFRPLGICSPVPFERVRASTRRLELTHSLCHTRQGWLPGGGGAATLSGVNRIDPAHVYQAPLIKSSRGRLLPGDIDRLHRRRGMHGSGWTGGAFFSDSRTREATERNTADGYGALLISRWALLPPRGAFPPERGGERSGVDASTTGERGQLHPGAGWVVRWDGPPDESFEADSSWGGTGVVWQAGRSRRGGRRGRPRAAGTEKTTALHTKGKGRRDGKPIASNGVRAARIASGTAAAQRSRCGGYEQRAGEQHKLPACANPAMIGGIRGQPVGARPRSVPP